MTQTLEEIQVDHEIISTAVILIALLRYYLFRKTFDSLKDEFVKWINLRNIVNVKSVWLLNLYQFYDTHGIPIQL